MPRRAKQDLVGVGRSSANDGSALERSGLLARYRKSTSGKQVRVFAKLAKLDTYVTRIESIYRPLIADPKEVHQNSAPPRKVMKKGEAEAAG